ncbi:MAG: peptidoglycan editing factor PgeF [Actinomycetaceae bacterium]|nr:peptidoglycan editing factor PgeF [Actinomycetaceae bacterium]
MIRYQELGGARIGFTRCRPAQHDATERPSEPNYGLSTRDQRNLVLADRRALTRQLGRPIAWMKQIHSDIVCHVSAETVSDENSVTADAVIVDETIGAAVQVADCIPILMADPQTRRAAAVHAGRAGVELNIVARTITRLVETGTSAQDLSVAVGPSICGSCYEVPREMMEEFTREHPQAKTRSRWGSDALDLRAVVEAQLAQCGVRQIIHDRTCTFESTKLNSYRRNRHCGRQVGWIYFPS